MLICSANKKLLVDITSGCVFKIDVTADCSYDVCYYSPTGRVYTMGEYNTFDEAYHQFERIMVRSGQKRMRLDLKGEVGNE